MLSLNSRKDGFRLLLPNEFIPDEINEKYSKILQGKKSFIKSPIDFLNESIVRIDILGVSNASFQQNQQGRSYYNNDYDMPYSESEVYYRSPASPIKLIDKTLNIEFRHTLGYLNYFLLMEIFWEAYNRDTSYDDLKMNFNVDIINNDGEIISRCVLYKPIIDGIDCLSLDYTKPISESGTFKVVFKYSNFDYEYLPNENNTEENTI